jgi:NADP-dependent 3-hydroxy acid dehydrogenase YdfG
MPNPLVMITGATHGIGQALARAFGAEGHALLLMARHTEKLDWLDDVPHRFAEVDVADFGRLAKAIAMAEAEFGPTDCLVNNAGFARFADFGSEAIDQIDYEIDVLFKGVVHGTRAVPPGMRKRKRGTIINISSIGDRRPGPLGVAYHASKHAVCSLAESLQQAEAKNNVRVIDIAPGFVKTNIHQNMGIWFEEYRRLTGNPDFIAPERIAEIVLFCYKQPQSICIRDIVIMPTTSAY